MSMTNIQNLKPPQSTEEARERGRKGGIASGKARRERKTMRQTLEYLLEEKGKQGKTYRELATLGLIKGAVNGNSQNYKTILEITGELNSVDSSAINEGIQNIAKLINNPVVNRTEETMKQDEEKQ